jgi:type III secretion system YscQ/HrcQ family protein
LDIPLPIGDKVFGLCPDVCAVAVPAPEAQGRLQGDGHTSGGGPLARDEIRVSLDVAGETWVVQAAGLLTGALLLPPEGLHLEDLPDELRPALWHLALEGLLDRASAALGRQVSLLKVETAFGGSGEAPDAGAATGAIFLLPFRLSDEQGQAAGTGAVLVPHTPDALSLLAEWGQTLPRLPKADLSALEISLSFCLWSEDFPLGLLRQAETGDVIRLSAPSVPLSERFALTLEAYDRPLWAAALADGIITITGSLAGTNTKDIAMPAATLDPASADPGPAQGMPPKPATPATGNPGDTGAGLSASEIDALEVRLTLELEERRITVGELATLTPGHTFSDVASLASPVTLKVNGSAVGKGRLVQVGDRLGVMITALSLTSSGGNVGK